MQIDIKPLPAKRQEELRQRIAELKLQVQALHESFQRLAGTGSAKGQLLAGAGGASKAAAGAGAGAAASSSAAAASLKGEAILSKEQQGSQVLKDSLARLDEVTAVAAGTLGELGRNRETLERIQGKTAEIHGDLDHARGITNRMEKREKWWFLPFNF